MNKKFLLLVISLVLVCFYVFSTDVPHEVLPSLHVGVFSVYPIDSVIGETVDISESDAHTFLAGALAESYSFEWAEKYLDEDTKNAVTMLYSSFLSNNLPTSNIIMSKEVENGDSSFSISVRFIDTSKAAMFVIKEDKISVISILQD